MLGPSPVVVSFYGHPAHPAVDLLRTREGQQFVVIELCIAECDQAFMPAPVMPVQVASRHGQRQAVVKDALQVFLVGVILVEVQAVEEICRWHLPRITHHHQVPSACDCPDGLTGGHLRCFIEYDKVELGMTQAQILGDGNRAHEHAWTERLQQVRNLIEELADGYAPAIIGDRFLQDAHFGGPGRLHLQVRFPRMQAGAYFLSGECFKRTGEFCETPYLLIEDAAVE